MKFIKTYQQQFEESKNVQVEYDVRLLPSINSTIIGKVFSKYIINLMFLIWKNKIKIQNFQKISGKIKVLDLMEVWNVV